MARNSFASKQSLKQKTFLLMFYTFLLVAMTLTNFQSVNYELCLLLHLHLFLLQFH